MATYTNTKATLGDQGALDALIAHTLTEFVDDGISTLGQYAMYKQTT